MRYIVCALALFLTACRNDAMLPDEIKARQEFCSKNGAKTSKLLTAGKWYSVYEVRCVFDGYETSSKYREEKK